MKNNFQFLIYRSAEEDISVDAFIKDDTIWLTQKGMAKLFDCTTDNISFHLKNIYAEGELDETATAEESSVVQMEGSRTDIFAECSIDYDRDSPLTHDFYAWCRISSIMPSPGRRRRRSCTQKRIIQKTTWA